MEQHLDQKARQIVAAYRALEAFLTPLEDVQVDPVKASISFKRRSAFASVKVGRKVAVSMALPVVPADDRFTAGQAMGDRRV